MTARKRPLTPARAARLGVLALVALGVSNCGKSQREPRAAWRDQAEAACLSSRLVQTSSYVSLRGKSIDGPGTCGMNTPFRVAAFGNGAVSLNSAATLSCPIISTTERWLSEVVQTAAMNTLGAQVIEMRAGSYSCRTMNNGSGTRRMSEHAYGNALDIFSFRLNDGRTVTVKNGWRGAPDEQHFLREVFLGACERFSTVLGPGSDMFHYDHLHVDLARHNGGRKICRPAVKATPRPEFDKPMRGPEGWMGAQQGRQGEQETLTALAPVEARPVRRQIAQAPLMSPALTRAPGGPIMLPGSQGLPEELVVGDVEETGVVDGTERDPIDAENDPFALDKPGRSQPRGQSLYQEPPPVKAQPVAPLATTPRSQAPAITSRPLAPAPVTQPAQAYQAAPVTRPRASVGEPPTPPGWIVGPQSAVR